MEKCGLEDMVIQIGCRQKHGKYFHIACGSDEEEYDIVEMNGEYRYTKI